MESDCLQFGFKKNSGCNDAIFTFIESEVDWLSMLSDPFVVHCGIHQGGILSPILFSVYVDDLIC